MKLIAGKRLLQEKSAMASGGCNSEASSEGGCSAGSGSFCSRWDLRIDGG